MIFSSFLFLFYFLPIMLGLYFITPRWGKNTLLVAASILFYAWGEPTFTLSLLLLCSIDYVLALLVYHSSGGYQRTFFILSILINVASLGYFKYSNFFVGEFNRFIGNFGVSALPWVEMALPIGISFFTFHKISYVTDVYRRIQRPAYNPIDYTLYILFFPQLISGPIVRYHEISDQLRQRKVTIDDCYEGLLRFSQGLAKKVLVADVVGHAATTMFSLKSNALPPSYAWIGIVAYTAQIYFDFSGYSDMAIGIARLFGFRFPENFDNPYLARSFSDFWRRWHMSFGRWMREYLYYPLGGNRCGPFRNYLNLWVVFLFSGLWHGAQWTFILWGVWHGFFMTIEKLFLDRLMIRVPVVIQTLLTLFLVMLSRVLFRADSLSHAISYYGRLVSGEGITKITPLGQLVTPFELFMIVVAYALCLWPLVIPNPTKLLESFRMTSPQVGIAVRGVTAFILLFLSVTAMAGTDFSPFIYFQF